MNSADQIVSVILPVRDGGRYLAEALEAVPAALVSEAVWPK